MKVLVIDNYDSFTYNLVQYLGELGAEISVARNDVATVEDLLHREPDRVVISPGPCTPQQAGVSIDVAKAFPEAGIPLLGVCLGHQALIAAFGGEVITGDPIHGKDAEVRHDGTGIYQGLPNPFIAGRYHSLIAGTIPTDIFEEVADAGEINMGVRHRELPAEGVQFHPESVLTPEGKQLLANFLENGVTRG